MWGEPLAGGQGGPTVNVKTGALGSRGFLMCWEHLTSAGGVGGQYAWPAVPFPEKADRVLFHSLALGFSPMKAR